MAKKNKDKKTLQKSSKENILSGIKHQTRQGIFAVVFIVLAIIFILASINNSDGGSFAGPVGKEIFKILFLFLGIGYFLLPVFFLMLGISFFKAEEKNLNKLKIFGGLFFFISGLGLINLISTQYWIAQGGYVGWVISTPLLKMFGFYASAIILIALLIISFLILFETKLTIDSLMFWKKKEKEEDENADEDIKMIADKAEEDEEKADEAEKEKEDKRDKKQSKGFFVKTNEDEESGIKYNPRRHKAQFQQRRSA